MQKLLEVAVDKEAALSNEMRGKKAIKKDVMLAYDTLDKALDLADEVFVVLRRPACLPACGFLHIAHAQC